MRRTDERVFADRTEAGRILGDLLAERLPRAAQSGALVLGLPRGGVPVAVAVAHRLGAELDITVARKIGFPGQPEFGIGAVSAVGAPVFDHATLRQAGITEASMSAQVDAERAEARRRLRRYRGNRPPPAIRDRLVVVVDDGLATGVTARAALRSVRLEQPAHTVFAAPVCAADSAEALAAEADTVLCAGTPRHFRAVGAWYAEFPQLTDAQVEAMLRAEWGAGH